MDRVVPAVVSVSGASAIVVGKKSLETEKQSLLTIDMFPSDWVYAFTTGELLSVIGFTFTAVAVYFSVRRYLEDKSE